ncbi:MAG TPA: DUF4426 domain-containing protein [Thermomonas sp.]|nr:DUF4426 domain-containing protein [Thermomonas sp.]
MNRSARPSLLRALLLGSLLLGTACNRDQPPVRAAIQNASPTASVGGAVLHASSMSLAELNPSVARRYGIVAGRQGLLLLVTVRGPAGNAIDPGDLRLDARVAVLPEPARPLALRPIRTNRFIDYIGVVDATPPASVHFTLSATRNGEHDDIATSAELYPR